MIIEWCRKEIEEVKVIEYIDFVKYTMTCKEKIEIKSKEYIKNGLLD